jgi:hypothetical protein
MNIIFNVKNLHRCNKVTISINIYINKTEKIYKKNQSNKENHLHDENY